MKALVYGGPGKKSWTDMPEPVIQHPTDVIVKMVATTICGTDLHILKGDVPEVAEGRILGHEGIGVITEVGSGVTQLAVGDRVILACVSSCGVCSNCRKGLYSHCLNPEGIPGIGWIFGYMIDGTQAEYVRVPFAENSVYKVADGVTTPRASCSPTSSPRVSRSGCSTGTSSQAMSSPWSEQGRSGSPP
ncbi:Alcohol dehydrogenase [Leifsonia shinshuensis]